jgi:hypothetical protein
MNIQHIKHITHKVLDTPYMQKEEIDDARLTLPPNIFKQEYLAEFLDSGGEVFTNISR